MMKKKSISLILLLLLPLLVMAKGHRQIWVIDAGHGGHDVGCEGTKSQEKDINLAVASRVAELVRSNLSDVKVIMTRSTDTYLTLERRASIANEAGADLFISIHVNACPDATNVRGTETYYGPIGATNSAIVEEARKRNIQKSELLAWEMQKYYGLAGRPINRGVKRERYYVILYTRMPSILTEIGFISTPSEQDYMMSDKGKEEIAECIFNGLKEYKSTISAGKLKWTLAQMRQTGAHFTCPPPPSTDLATAASANDKPDSSATTPTTKNTASKKNIPATDLSAEAKLEPELDSDDLSFSIQIFSLKKQIKEGDKRFKGLKNIKITQKDGVYKYLYGTTSSYEEARKELAEVRTLFPDAFLVAFLGSRSISTADAQEMYIKKK